MTKLTPIHISAVLLAGAATLGFQRSADAVPPLPSHVAPVITVPAISFVDCGECFQVCGGGSHAFYNGGSPGEDNPDRSYGEGNHLCENGWCGTAHPSQGCLAEEQEQDFVALTDEQKLAIWEAYRSGSAHLLAEVTAGLGSAVLINGDRRSLQIRDCGGAVVANLPLSRGQFAVLAA